MRMPRTNNIYRQYSLAGQTLWPPVNGLIKTSICLTFIRIFFTKPFRVTATAVYVLSIGWSIATILVGYLICSPLSELWTKSSEGHCGHTTAAYVSLGVLDMVLDIAVFSLPIPMLYKLQVPRRTKVALVATFGLGVFTIAAGIMRLVAVVQIDYKINFEQGQVADAYWCTIESAVGIIVACTMTLRPLLDRLLVAFQSQLPRLHCFRNGRHTASHHISVEHPYEINEKRFLVRLSNEHELCQKVFPTSQPTLKNPTKRASFELV